MEIFELMIGLLVFKVVLGTTEARGIALDIEAWLAVVAETIPGTEFSFFVDELEVGVVTLSTDMLKLPELGLFVGSHMAYGKIVLRIGKNNFVVESVVLRGNMIWGTAIASMELVPRIVVAVPVIVPMASVTIDTQVSTDSYCEREGRRTEMIATNKRKTRKG